MNAGPAGFAVTSCPKCGTNIQIPEGANTSYCMYCGTQLIYNDGSATVTYRAVDEARIREAEIKRELELKRLELQERRRPLKIAASIALAVIGLAMVIGG